MYKMKSVNDCQDPVNNLGFYVDLIFRIAKSILIVKEKNVLPFLNQKFSLEEK